MRSLTILGFVVCWLTCHTAWMPSPVHAKNKTKTSKKARKAKPFKLERNAAEELVNWLAPLSPGGKQDLGLRTVRQWINTWIASRWGIRATRKSWKRWVALMRYLRTWQPAPLYRDMRFKRVYPQLYYNLKGSHFRMTAPKPNEAWKGKVGDGQMTMEERQAIWLQKKQAKMDAILNAVASNNS